MASTFSTNLALELIGTGDQAGTWGNTTNTNLGTLIEQAISGYVTQAVTTGNTTTLTIPDGASGVARNMYIELTGTGGTNTNLIVPANKKLYFIFNNSTGAVTVKVSGQTGVSVAATEKKILVSNGTDIVEATSYLTAINSSLTLSTLSVASLTISSGTANGVLYLNASKAATSGSALVFDGTNLGIGTASPASALVVNQTVDSGTARIDLQNTGAGGSTDYSEFRLLSTAGTARTAVFRMRNNIEASIGSVTNDPFTFITNNTERARITATGNLLVGTTTDVSGFSGVISDVAGNVRNIPSAGAAKTSEYTLTISDIGEFVTIGTSGKVLVPNNTFATGNAISVYNDTTGGTSINISTTTGYVVGTNTNRTGVTLATRGIATILFINPSYCIISGNVS